MNRLQLYRLIISVLGILVCAQGVALFVILNWHDPSSARGTVAAPAAASVAPVSEPAGDARPQALPREFEPPSVQKTADAAPPGVFVPKPVDVVRLQALQKKFETLSAQGEPDLREVDALFAELIEIQGTSVIAGVDLNVVRQNLRIARDLQQVTREMDAEYKKPAPDAAKMEDLRRQATVLQNQLLAGIHGQPAGGAPSSGSVR
jgi:hypothetical protein